MPLALPLWSVAALLAVAVLAVPFGRTPHASRLVYGACLAIAGVLFAGAVARLVAQPLTEVREILPIGLPWIGARFRLDALSCFFLAVVDLGAVAASLYAIGYGALE